MKNESNLPYNPELLKRELKKYYISSSQNDINEMLSEINKMSLEELYTHLNSNLKFSGQKLDDLNSLEELSYEELPEYFQKISLKNNIKTSFIGDGLKNYSVPDIVPFVCSLRGLTTAYTPYQPERRSSEDLKVN